MVQTTQDKREIYARAMTLLSGQSQEPTRSDLSEAFRLMQSAAEHLPPAQAMLSVLIGLGLSEKTDTSTARAMFLKSAMQGFPPSIRGLATLLLQSDKTVNMGGGLLRRAAAGGDWVAAFLMLREAERGRYFGAASELRNLAGLLTPAVPFRDRLQAFANSLANDLNMIPSAPFEKKSCETCLQSWAKVDHNHTGHALNATPKIESFTATLSPLLCDYLIATTIALMQPSKVVDAEEAGAISAQYRSSDGAVLLPAQMDFVHVCILRRLSAFAGIKPQQGEFLSLLRYRPGQEYRPHHDYLVADAKDYSKVKACGQRTKTLLTYLNSEFEGGETEFPNLSISYKGQTGDALLFENTDSQSRPVENSLHAGTPVITGEKWLATLWCRERAFWPWARN